VEIFKFKEKIRVRDEERSKGAHELELYQNRLRDCERALALRELNDKSIDSELQESKARTAKMEEKCRLKEKEIESLKKRLLQAKIQTIHQIREVIG
jgi:GTPase involved in cell partitioning and DNA repair